MEHKINDIDLQPISLIEAVDSASMTVVTLGCESSGCDSGNCVGSCHDSCYSGCHCHD